MRLSNARWPGGLLWSGATSSHRAVEILAGLSLQRRLGATATAAIAGRLRATPVVVGERIARVEAATAGACAAPAACGRAEVAHAAAHHPAAEAVTRQIRSIRAAVAIGVRIRWVGRLVTVAARVEALLVPGVDDRLHARIDAVGILRRLVHVPADHAHRGIALGRGRHRHLGLWRGRPRHGRRLLERTTRARIGAPLQLAPRTDEVLDPLL